MEKARLSKYWLLERYLPPELWSGMLCRLPVKSLLRFRCVSKPWLSLIDDPDFARLHLKSFKNNHQENNLFVVQGQEQQCVVRCSHTFKPNSDTLYTLGREYGVGSWIVVCSIDGLIMLRMKPYSGIPYLRVWNPSIRKFHRFPSLPQIELSPNSHLSDTEIGLGYDPSANDYKHVKLIFSLVTLQSVAIYSLGSKSWKKIPYQGKGWSIEQWRPYYDIHEIVCFSGNLYFFVHSGYNSLCQLLSFDFSSEVFSSVSMPDVLHNMSPKKGYRLALIDGGRSLAMFTIKSSDKSVWVLESSSAESESFCWTKRYSFVDLTFVGLLYLKKNGDVLTQIETLTTETDEESVAWCQVQFNCPEADEYKILQQRKGSPYYFRHVCGYVESLIMLK